MRFLLIGALAALLGSGCATITRGSSQSWTVETDPAGADVKLSSGEICKSPCTLEKKRKHAFSVDISKEGYEAVHTEIVSSISGGGAAGMAGNVIFGGLIGAGIDAGTGATKDLKPNPLVIKLVPVATPIPAPAEATASAAVPAQAPVPETATTGAAETTQAE